MNSQDSDSAITNEMPLQGWKEIAAYLERDQRTARRWELEEGLPIRRLRADRRSSVYAYPREIETWRSSRPAQRADAVALPIWRQARTWGAAAAMAAAIAAVVYGPILNPEAPTAEAAEGSIRSEAVLTGGKVSGFGNGLSPDGTFIIGTDWSTGDLWLWDTETGEGRQITNKGAWGQSGSYAEGVAISPDGLRLASGWYNDETGSYELRVGSVPPPGATDEGTRVVEPTLEQAGYVQPYAWLSESEVFFYHAGAGHNRIAVLDLADNTLSTLREFRRPFVDPVVSPDRKWVAVALWPESGEEQYDITVFSTDGSTETNVVEHPAEDYPVAWTPDGSRLLFRSTRTGAQSLWALPLENGRSAGQPQLARSEFGATASLGIDPEGSLFYPQRTGSIDILEVEMDFDSGQMLSEPQQVVVSVVGDNFDAVYSPDGNRMAYLTNRGPGISRFASSRIVVRDIDTGTERLMPPRFRGLRNLAWSADSTSLLYSGRETDDSFGVHQLTIASELDRKLFRPRGGGRPRDLGWAAGDLTVHYRAGYGASHWTKNLATGEETLLLEATAPVTVERSPDGRRFAGFELLDSTVVVFTIDAQTKQREDIARIPMPEGAAKQASALVWTPNGEKLVFWMPQAVAALPGGRGRLWIVSIGDGEARASELTADYLSQPADVISIHPDGRMLAYSAGNQAYEIWKLSNFLERLGASD